MKNYIFLLETLPVETVVHFEAANWEDATEYANKEWRKFGSSIGGYLFQIKKREEYFEVERGNLFVNRLKPHFQEINTKSPFIRCAF